MPTLPHHQLKRIATALDADFRGAKVQAIRDSGMNRLAFELYAEGSRRWLQMWVVPGCAGLHLCTQTPTSAEAGAGTFVRELRRRILNARIRDFRVDEGDRILRVELSIQDESFRLIFEVFGTAPNLFLLDGGGRILNQLRSSVSAQRNLHPGSTYTAPPPGPLRPPPPQREIEDLEELHKTLEDQFAASFLDKARNQYRSERLKPLKQDIKKTRRLIARLEDDRQKAGDPEQIRAQAHILAANLGGLTKGTTEVQLQNPGVEGLPEFVTITLNPALSPIDNMERMYQRARRGTRTRDQVALRLAEARKHLGLLEDELLSLENSEDPGPAPNAAPTAAAGTPKGKTKATLAKGLERVAHVHKEPDGALILVGKNARSNDELLRRFAHGNDHWLHVRDGRGSHVIVRPAPGTEVKDSVINRAASLAAGHSSLRKEAQVDVLWTRCKHVRSAKGAPAGTVHVASSRTLRVKPKRSDG